MKNRKQKPSKKSGKYKKRTHQDFTPFLIGNKGKTKRCTEFFTCLVNSHSIASSSELSPQSSCKSHNWSFGTHALDTVQWKNPLAHSCSCGFCPQVIYPRKIKYFCWIHSYKWRINLCLKKVGAIPMFTVYILLLDTLK